MIHLAEDGDVQVAKVAGHQPRHDVALAVRQQLVAAGETLDDHVNVVGLVALVDDEWMIGIGRRSAYTRIAHVLCELLVRMRSVGLANGNNMELAVTQAELGDALGLSTVHVNRVLQELRGDGLIVLRGRFLSVQDWPGLKKAGEFDVTYLHLAPKAEAAAA